MRRMVAFVFLGAALALPAAADRSDDDLQAVRKAVASSSAPASAAPQEKSRPPAEEEPAAPQARRPLKSSDLKWLHVRVAPKAGSKNGRVSVNVPLGLVKLFGDDWPIPTGPSCQRHDRCHLTLGDILRALDSGQTLVDIEDDEASVKVWVEEAVSSPAGYSGCALRATLDRALRSKCLSRNAVPPGMPLAT